MECLRFWVGVSIENDRKQRPLKTLFKVEWFENGDVWRRIVLNGNIENGVIRKRYNNNLYIILGFKTSANKGNENEQKRSNGNTPVFVPGALGENGVMGTVQDHRKAERFENGAIWKRSNGNVALGQDIWYAWKIVLLYCSRYEAVLKQGILRFFVKVFLISTKILFIQAHGVPQVSPFFRRPRLSGSCKVRLS